MRSYLKLSVCVVTFLLVFFLAALGSGASRAKLEKIASSDAIYEYRAAAGMALSDVYAEAGIDQSELLGVATTGSTEEIRNAIIPALADLYRDVSDLTSSAELQVQAEGLRGKLSQADLPQVREAAARALSSYFVAFNLNDVDGYRMEDLEQLVESSEVEEIRYAAARALPSIYASEKSLEDLEDLLEGEASETIKEAAAEALGLRYGTSLFPNYSVEEMEQMAGNEELNPWHRKAAGIAFGRLAHQEKTLEELTRLTKAGATPELQNGATKALAEKLIQSEKTHRELLKMAVSATSWAPEPYRMAIVEALADRLRAE